MSSVKIFWDPKGREVDPLGRKGFLRLTEADTPHISMTVRLLNIDTPEVRYPGNRKPSRHDSNLARLAEWIEKKKAPVNPELGEHLYPRLATGKAGTLQGEQGKQALNTFRNLLNEKLKLPGGEKRDLFLYVADEHFDEHGRLMVYMAPYYSDAERESMTRKDRATFNLLMVESGWAAPFPVYPSIPRVTDLALLQEAAKNAFDGKRGIWADPMTLTGYEFRMCVKLYDITKKMISGKKLVRSERRQWISRYCVDMTTREVFFPQDYFKVKPYNRVFIWPESVPEAVGRMNLLPAGTGM